MFGKGEFKYDFLSNNSFKSIYYKELPNIVPNYLFVSKNAYIQVEFDRGFCPNGLKQVNVAVLLLRDREIEIFTSNFNGNVRGSGRNPRQTNENGGKYNIS